MRRLGWDHRDEFGWFMSAASVPLALAIVALTVVHLLVWRYDLRAASGAFDGPRVASGIGAPILGAAIGDVPDDASLAALKTELDARLHGIPWKRALVLRNRGSALAIQSLFFPFNSTADALGFCRLLTGTVPDCTTVIASSDALATFDRAPATAKLARLGIAPYTGGGATKVVYVPKTIYIASKNLAPQVITKTITVHDPAPAPQVVTKTIVVQAPPQIVTKTVVVHDAAPAPAPATVVAANAQAPLKLQPGVGTADPHYPETQIWLSTTYRPGDSRLTDIVGAGDVMMGSISSGLNPALKPGIDVASLVGNDLAGIFRHADVAFVNLEGPLYEGALGTGKDCAQCFAFHGPTFYAGILHSLGVDVVSLANNHSGDYGEAGRDSTMAALKANGIAYGGLDRDGARAGEMVLPNGKRVALVAFAPNNGTLNINDLPRAAQIVRDLKKTHDLVMVSFHGGGEGWTYVHVAKGTEMFVGENRGNVTAFAHTVIDAGADIVIGQGPHVPRAVEVYRGHLIAYSLGNFWTYSGVQTYAVSGLGPVLEAWVAPDGQIAGFTIHSTRQAGLGVPHLDPLDEASRYMLYLTKSDFPTTAALLSGHRTLASNDVP
jgi:poly-gamma-glutamate capsule biosynthesis protein CapA/YwtB (metallophosphatase superfamily)